MKRYLLFSIIITFTSFLFFLLPLRLGEIFLVRYYLDISRLLGGCNAGEDRVL